MWINIEFFETFYSLNVDIKQEGSYAKDANKKLHKIMSINYDVKVCEVSSLSTVVHDIQLSDFHREISLITILAY